MKRTTSSYPWIKLYEYWIILGYLTCLDSISFTRCWKNTKMQHYSQMYSDCTITYTNNNNNNNKKALFQVDFSGGPFPL